MAKARAHAANGAPASATPPLVPHPNYYEIKAAQLEFELDRHKLGERLAKELKEQMQARMTEGVAALTAKRDAVVKACGFDPAKNWKLNEDTKTITEAPTTS